jgi:hypothetical protein
MGDWKLPEHVGHTFPQFSGPYGPAVYVYKLRGTEFELFELPLATAKTTVSEVAAIANIWSICIILSAIFSALMWFTWYLCFTAFLINVSHGGLSGLVDKIE